MADVGSNCWVNQQVTIGYKDQTGRPKIGDNVRITAEAKVIGNIKIIIFTTDFISLKLDYYAVLK
ncbi:MAG: hypothetical protein WBM32_06525 [Crocosphaera sp.]|jgi:serine O-acetyltransferase